MFSPSVFSKYTFRFYYDFISKLIRIVSSYINIIKTIIFNIMKNSLSSTQPPGRWFSATSTGDFPPETTIYIVFETITNFLFKHSTINKHILNNYCFSTVPNSSIFHRKMSRRFQVIVNLTHHHSLSVNSLHTQFSTYTQQFSFHFTIT